jgi:hypothetical protein
MFLSQNEAIKIVLDTQDEDMKVLPNVGKYLPVDTVASQKTHIFILT